MLGMRIGWESRRAAPGALTLVVHFGARWHTAKVLHAAPQVRVHRNSSVDENRDGLD